MFLLKITMVLSFSFERNFTSVEKITFVHMLYFPYRLTTVRFRLFSKALKSKGSSRFRRSLCSLR